jgi:hypothetical protein
VNARPHRLLLLLHAAGVMTVACSGCCLPLLLLSILAADPVLLLRAGFAYYHQLLVLWLVLRLCCQQLWRCLNICIPMFCCCRPCSPSQESC